MSYTSEPYNQVEYSRPPTASEIKRGYGATHYKHISLVVARKPDGTLKKWTVCPVDGLRYYRCL